MDLLKKRALESVRREIRDLEREKESIEAKLFEAKDWEEIILRETTVHNDQESKESKE